MIDSKHTRLNSKLKNRVKRYGQLIIKAREKIERLKPGLLLNDSGLVASTIQTLNEKIDFFETKQHNLIKSPYILSDSIDSIESLQTKIDSCRMLSLFFRRCNSTYKAKNSLSDIRITPHWKKIIDENIERAGVPFTPLFFSRIRRKIKFSSDRIKALNTAREFSPFTVNGIDIFLRDGQLRVKFPSIPDQVTRDILKNAPISLRWSSYSQAWVRKFTGQDRDYFTILRNILIKTTYQEE